MSGKEVTVVDLGMGNLRSVARALERAGGVPRVTGEPARIAAAERLVFPGQGHFGGCSVALASGAGDALRAFLETGRPYLGICLGMQALFGASEEAPEARGLGVLPGEVRRLVPAPGAGRLSVPHVGWNALQSRDRRLDGRWYYFVHSYVCVPADEGLVAARADHGGAFCAAVARGPLLAVQFHPEKSGAEGQALLESFVGGAAWS